MVDDGSSDQSIDVLEGYGTQINLIKQKNRGTQAARNRGVQNAVGELIAILDSDDMWLPEKLEKQVEVLSQLPEVGLVYSFANTIDSDGKRLNLDWHLGQPLGHPSGALAQLLLGCFIPALTVVFRKQCIDEVGLFDENLLGSGDWDMWLRIAKDHQLACVEEPLALYRVHATNTTKLLYHTKAIRSEHEQVLRKAFQAPEARSLPEAIRNQALARTCIAGAEAEALAGSAEAVGRELRNAFELDPTLLEDWDELIGLFVHWSHLYALTDHQGNPYRRFVSKAFDEIPNEVPSLVKLRRSVLSNAVMSIVFSAHQAGDRKLVRKLIMSGLYANPSWLRNRGVWSIMADAYLGKSVTTRIRGSLNRLRA